MLPHVSVLESMGRGLNFGRVICVYTISKCTNFVGECDRIFNGSLSVGMPIDFYSNLHWGSFNHIYALKMKFYIHYTLSMTLTDSVDTCVCGSQEITFI